MNLRIVGKYLSYLLWAEAAFMAVPALVSLYYGEFPSLGAFAASALLCVGAGWLFHLPCRGAKGALYIRESFVIAGTGWVFISLFGAFPFFFSGGIPNFINAFFESVSGFSTTGASILQDVGVLSKGLIFWRSFTLWLGGIGVVSFLVAILHSQEGSGRSLNLLRAEIPGPQVGKLLPKTRESIRMMYGIYLGLSGLTLLFLLLGRMPLFDALCTMFGTAGTGGFSFRNDSFSSFSTYLQIVCAVFMALFGINFSLYFLLPRRQWKAFFKDEELRLYLSIIAGAVVLVTISLFSSGFGSLPQSLHHAFFTVS
ncbi:MAG: potassium transporter TrkG, partial [Oscillospiraceae bacterium]